MATTKFSTIIGSAQVVPVVGPTTFQTLVIGGSVSAPTMGTNTNAYTAMQDGEKLEMSLSYFQNAAGAAGSGIYVFPLPPGRTVSVLECPVSHYNGSGLGVVGECEFWDGTKLYEGTVHVFNATNLYCTIGNEVTTPTQMGSATFSLAGTNWRLSFKARFLCTEFVNNGYVAQGAGLKTSVKPGLEAPGSPQINIAAQVSSAQAGFSVVRAVATAYSDVNGVWNMKGHIDASFTGVVTTSFLSVSVTIAGITFKTGYSQPITTSWGGSNATANGNANGGTSNMTVYSNATSGASNATNIRITFDVELDSKPSWA